MSTPELRDQDPEVKAQLTDAHAAWGAGRRDEAVRGWRMLVARAPAVAAPYLNLARVGGHGRTGWLEDAAATLAVGDPAVLRNLGVLAQARDAPALATSCFRRALMSAPGDTACLSGMAKLRGTIGWKPGDWRWILRALVADPAREERWIELLSRLLNEDAAELAAHWADALPIPLAERPAVLLRLVANAYAKSARYGAALTVLVRLTEVEPFDVSARALRGAMHRRTGDRTAAVRQVRLAVVLDPSPFDAYGALGTELARADRHAEAVVAYRRALRIQPERRAEVLENYGATLVKADCAAEASRILREALVRRPLQGAGYLNYSTLAIQTADLDTAARFGQIAVMVRPDVAGARYNLGSIRRHQGRVEDARRLLDEACALEDNPSYGYVRAMLELGDGDPEDGLRRYECRWEVPGFSSTRQMGHTPTLPLPAWQGEPRPDARLAVWAEQGIGDELWFAGYLGWAAERVGRVVVEVAGSLQPLLQRSFPGVEVRARGEAGSEEAVASADLQAPMGGLPRLSGAATRPVPAGYLRPDSERVRRLRNRYATGRPDARVIGVSWRSVKPVRGKSFEACLAAWAPLFALEDAVFVSLQYGDVAADAELVRQRFGRELVCDPEIDAYRDLDALAAQMAATDAVVTVANSTVALAHGLGKPAYVLMRRIQDDWRYTRGSETARWLPTARCFWQTDAADWRTPAAMVAERLRREA